MTSLVAVPIWSNFPWIAVHIWTAKLCWYIFVAVVIVVVVAVIVVVVATVKVILINMGSCLQPADACAGYPVTHYNLSFRSSGMNQSAVMLGPYAPESGSRVDITLNSSDGIYQNVRYHFQILAVNTIGSSTSREIEFCKNCICYQEYIVIH